MPKKPIRHYPGLMYCAAVKANIMGIQECCERGDVKRIMEEYLPLLDELAEEAKNIPKWYREQGIK